jgi:hypothetical protein
MFSKEDSMRVVDEFSDGILYRFAAPSFSRCDCCVVFTRRTRKAFESEGFSPRFFDFHWLAGGLVDFKGTP